jgi:hypothetical protein
MNLDGADIRNLTRWAFEQGSMNICMSRPIPSPSSTLGGSPAKATGISSGTGGSNAGRRIVSTDRVTFRQPRWLSRPVQSECDKITQRVAVETASEATTIRCRLISRPSQDHAVQLFRLAATSGVRRICLAAESNTRSTTKPRCTPFSFTSPGYRISRGGGSFPFGGNVNQTFQWTERRPCPCDCPSD